MQGHLVEMEPPENIFESFKITYDGKPLRDHTFDTELYATSLIGFCHSFKKANKILYNINIDIKIEAEKEGSLESLLQFLVENQETAQVINTYAELAKNTVEGLGWTGGCIFGTYKLLIGIIKKAKGKKENLKKEVKKLNLRYKLSQQLIKLLLNKTFRKGLDQLTFFLASPEMEYLEIRDSQERTIRITQNERPYFIEQPEDETDVKLDDTVVSIIYPSAQRTKWRFIIDGIERWAEVTDKKFLKEMQDKPLDFFEDIQFSARVETTTIKKVDALKPEVSRKIFNFSLHTPPQIGSLL